MRRFLARWVRARRIPGRTTRSARLPAVSWGACGAAWLAIFSAGMVAGMSPEARAATTHLVRPDGTGDHPTIQAAIDAAEPGDVIELAAGTFTGSGNRDLDPAGKALHIRAQGGDPATCILDCQGGQADPHRGFVFTHGEGAGSILEDLTITGGWAYRAGPTASPADARGGAIYCAGASPVIRGCVLSANTAEFDGGALYCADDAAVSCEDCDLTGNHAANGGGAFCRDDGTIFSGCRFADNTARSGAGLGLRGSAAALSACVFTNNAADVGGGALSIDDAAGVSLSACELDGNRAAYGGAASCFNGGAPAFAGCVFTDNAAEGAGDWPAGCGAGLFSDVFSSPALSACEFHGNAADADGGGFYTNGTQTSVTACTFRENTAGGSGGGSYADSDFLEVADCLYRDNAAAVAGGGVFLRGGFPELRGCTFYSNEAADGGGIALEAGTFALAACTLHRNSAARGGGLAALAGAVVSLERTLVIGSEAGEGVTCAGCGSLALSCCDLYGNSGGDWVGGAIAAQLGTDGNISASPHFCYAHPERYDEWSLHEDSACAEAQSGCGLIGAWAADCSDTPARRARWGEIKALFRK